MQPAARFRQCRSSPPRRSCAKTSSSGSRVILQVYYQNDGNQTHLVKAPDGTSLREFNHPNQIGFNLTLQARY